jgi:hypothetical protein
VPHTPCNAAAVVNNSVGGVAVAMSRCMKRIHDYVCAAVTRTTDGHERHVGDGAV